MRLVLRLLLLLPLGLVIALPFGGLTLLVGAGLDPAARDLFGALGLASVGPILADLRDGYPPDEAAVALFLGLWTSVVALLVVPPALVAAVGEVIGLRSFVWYGGATGALTAALPWLARARSAVARSAEAAASQAAEGRITALLFLTGAVSGLAYWLVAGRSAGRDPLPHPARGRARPPSP